MTEPERFDLSYAAPGGERVRPVMAHRSLAGSMERLFAHLIEAHDGAFPAWYAPVQLAVLPVGSGQVDAAAAGRGGGSARATVQVVAGGSLGSRIGDASQARIPYAGVVGDREAAAGTVSLRSRDGRAYGPMPADAAFRLITIPGYGSRAVTDVPGPHGAGARSVSS